MTLRSLLGVVALLLALVGCGGEDPAARIQAAQQATLDAGSARFAINQDISGGAAGDQNVTSEGALDFEGRRGRILTEVPDTGLGAGEVETVFDAETVFLRLPEGSAPTPWVRIDLDDAEGIPALEQLQQFSSDPSQQLSLLSGVDGDVERVSEEQVRGAQATHYRFTIDLERAAEAASEDSRAMISEQIDALGVTELPTDLWLDGEGRIVRQAYVLDLAGDAGEASTAIEFFDFGVAVDVQPPPDAEVTDFQDLLESGG
jgi:hypothetical protein